MLEVRDLVVSHGAIAAVRGVSLEVAAGEIVALIGANGAGKSSLLEAISGMARPVAGGTIAFAGQRIERRPAHEILASGIAHVPEDRLILTRMTVAENLMVAAPASMPTQEARRLQREIMARLPDLADRRDMQAAGLSGGQRQFLAVGRGMMACPRLMLMDEPTLGLSPAATDAVFGLIAQLRDDGLGLLVVDQNVKRLLTIADRALVLDLGRITIEGPARQVLCDDGVMDAYLGKSKGRMTS